MRVAPFASLPAEALDPRAPGARPAPALRALAWHPSQDSRAAAEGPGAGPRAPAAAAPRAEELLAAVTAAGVVLFRAATPRAPRRAAPAASSAPPPRTAEAPPPPLARVAALEADLRGGACCAAAWVVGGAGSALCMAAADAVLIAQLAGGGAGCAPALLPARRIALGGRPRGLAPLPAGRVAVAVDAPLRTSRAPAPLLRPVAEQRASGPAAPAEEEEVDAAGAETLDLRGSVGVGAARGEPPHGLAALLGGALLSTAPAPLAVGLGGAADGGAEGADGAEGEAERSARLVVVALAEGEGGDAVVGALALGALGPVATPDLVTSLSLPLSPEAPAGPLRVAVGSSAARALLLVDVPPAPPAGAAGAAPVVHARVCAPPGTSIRPPPSPAPPAGCERAVAPARRPRQRPSPPRLDAAPPRAPAGAPPAADAAAPSCCCCSRRAGPDAPSRPRRRLRCAPRPPRLEPRQAAPVGADALSAAARDCRAARRPPPRCCSSVPRRRRPRRRLRSPRRRPRARWRRRWRRCRRTSTGGLTRSSRCYIPHRQSLTPTAPAWPASSPAIRPPRLRAPRGSSACVVCVCVCARRAGNKRLLQASVLYTPRRPRAALPASPRREAARPGPGPARSRAGPWRASIWAARSLPASAARASHQR